jgi:hypothetical protein
VSQAQQRWVRMIAALAARQGSAPTPAGLCVACAEILAPRGAGIVLMADNGTPGATYASSELAAKLEELQFTLGVGPGPDAFRRGVPISESDLVARPPPAWIGFNDPAVKDGTRAALAFPLQVGAARIGTLTLYRDRAGPLGDDIYADALVMADIATLAFLAMQSRVPDGALPDELSDDGAYPAEIHQASGMVSVQLDMNVGEALLRLRARAVADSTSLAQLAAAVISREIRFHK